MRIIPNVGPDTTYQASEVIALMASDAYRCKRNGDHWRLELIVSSEEMTVINIPDSQVEELRGTPGIIRFGKDEALLVIEDG